MRAALTILICLFMGNAFGQNLIFNPSLEDYTDCNLAGGYIFKAPHWLSPGYPNWPTIYGSNCSPDYLNSCIGPNTNISIPYNTLGFQPPKDGNACLGLFLFSYSPTEPDSIYNDTSTLREYATVELNHSLQAGKRYCFKFYVSLADNSDYSISKIGVIFTNDTLFHTGLGAISQTPQIENNNNTLLNDTVNWIEISGTFISNGSEHFATIGNFRNYNESNASLISNSLIGGIAYYFVDMLSLELCDDVGVDENQLDKIKVYPNPAEEFINITVTQSYINTNAELSIYNLTGQLIMQKQLTQANQTIPITELVNGMYIFVVQAGERVIGRQRVVVVR